MPRHRAEKTREKGTLIITLLLQITLCSSKSPDHKTYTKLFNDLFSAKDVNGNKIYNPEVLPIGESNSSNPVVVNALLYANQLLDFNHETQALSMVFWLTMDWKDERLAWNPADYNGINETQVRPSNIWVPDLQLYNAADDNFRIGGLSEQVMAVLSYDGTISWFPMVLYTFSCRMNLHYFPFDYQTCYIKLGTWIYDADRMNLNLKSDKVNLNFFIKSNTWHLVENYALINEISASGYSPNGDQLYTLQDMKFFFVLKRNPVQYMINILVTCIIFSFICAFSFILPFTVNSDRLSLSLTIVISVSVYQLVAMDVIPTGSDEITILSWFLTLLVFLIMISVLITLFSMVLNDQTHLKLVPEWIFKFLVEGKYGIGRLFRINKCDTYHCYLRRLKLTEEQNQELDELILQEDCEIIKVIAGLQWNLVTISIDRLSMVLYFIVMLGSIIWLLLYQDLDNFQMKAAYDRIFNDVDGLKLK